MPWRLSFGRQDRKREVLSVGTTTFVLFFSFNLGAIVVERRKLRDSFPDSESEEAPIRRQDGDF